MRVVTKYYNKTTLQKTSNINRLNLMIRTNIFSVKLCVAIRKLLGHFLPLNSIRSFVRRNSKRIKLINTYTDASVLN